jgi:hypothetical protein
MLSATTTSCWLIVLLVCDFAKKYCVHVGVLYLMLHPPLDVSVLRVVRSFLVYNFVSVRANGVY